jgi:hypothetical protein
MTWDMDNKEKIAVLTRMFVKIPKLYRRYNIEHLRMRYSIFKALSQMMSLTSASRFGNTDTSCSNCAYPGKPPLCLA